MLKDLLVQETVTEDVERAVTPSEATIPMDRVLQLIARLREAQMIQGEITPPGEWILRSEVSVAGLVDLLKEHLSKEGWRRIVEAIRQHNRETEGPLWDLARPTDFLAAVEETLARQQAPSETEELAVSDLSQALQRQVQSLMRERMKPAGLQGWLLSPRALIARLSARARQARTEAQIESALSEAALYAARMAGTDAERDVALTRVERLRQQLRPQLEVFCEEQGLPLPKPYSREEAYYLHLLHAYFVALAEAEDAIARRGAALARRQIALEGERAEDRINSRLLPGLVETRREINPLREALFRERMRHRIAMLVGGVIGAVGGGLWGVVESVTDLLVGGIARYAPVVAPALLVGLVTLVVQTVVYRGPFTLGVVAGFLFRALWNGLLTLGATILAYGCWLYIVSRRQEPSASNPTTETEAQEEQNNDAEATDDVA